jgi:ABC-type protease/lipase transport system fused ATPase/permease subunit
MRAAKTEDIVGAARLAGVHQTILELPEGYDADIGEEGVLLSGGQRQRIALARALFGNPRLLVLDEPNANLDSEGEEALLRALSAAKSNGTTVVLIAHRPSVLSVVDKLLVLQDGRIKIFGPVAEVLPKVASAKPRPRLVRS